MEEVIKCQERVIEKIKKLSASRLKAALDFIEYLEEKEEWEATWEVLSNKESMEKIEDADDVWEGGKVEEFIGWDKVRRDVQDSSAQ